MPIIKVSDIRGGKKSLVIKQDQQGFLIHSEKSPARPMLFYNTNYWQQF